MIWAIYDDIGIHGCLDQDGKVLASISGEIYSYSTLFQAPLGYEGFIPYTVALVKLKEGPLMSAQLTDMDSDEAHPSGHEGRDGHAEAQRVRRGWGNRLWL